MRRLITRPVVRVAVPFPAFAIAWICVTACAEGQTVVGVGAAAPSAAAQGQPAIASSSDQPPAVTTHPQVSMTAFTRAYRSYPSVHPVSAGDAVPGMEVALEKPASRFEFNETPLRDVIAKIRDAHSIPVELDQKALADAGFDLDTPITQCLSGISLRSALRLLLDNIGLTYLVKNEVLLSREPPARASPAIP